MTSKARSAAFLLALSLSLASAACSSGPAVKSQAYAKLSDHRTYEYDIPVAMRGIEKALSGLKIVRRDPDEVSDLEARKLTSRRYETDWVYGQSRDKYVEYAVNDSPRRKMLQTRYKFDIEARSRIGGTDVSVRMTEEIERLKDDGTPAGYVAADEPDTSRVAEMLEKIQLGVLSAPPSNEVR